MAPWLVEDAPALWMDRRQEWTAAKNERDEHAAKKSSDKSGKQKAGKRKRRLF